MSHKAAYEGLAMCCAARLFWNIPILFCTPILTSAFYRTAFFKANKWAYLPCQVVVGTAMLMVGIYPVGSPNDTLPSAMGDAILSDNSIGCCVVMSGTSCFCATSHHPSIALRAAIPESARPDTPWENNPRVLVQQGPLSARSALYIYISLV